MSSFLEEIQHSPKRPGKRSNAAVWLGILVTFSCHLSLVTRIESSSGNRTGISGLEDKSVSRKETPDYCMYDAPVVAVLLIVSRRSAKARYSVM